MAKIGYAQATGPADDLKVQLRHLELAGCETVQRDEEDQTIQSHSDRLVSVIEKLQPEDELVVICLNALGKSLREVVANAHHCDLRGVTLTILKPAMSTKGDHGRVIFTVLDAVGVMERNFIKRRQLEGIARAKAKTGSAKVYRGGKARYDRSRIIALREEGKSIREISQMLGISRTQLYQIFRGST